MTVMKDPKTKKVLSLSTCVTSQLLIKFQVTLLSNIVQLYRWKQNVGEGVVRAYQSSRCFPLRVL